MPARLALLFTLWFGFAGSLSADQVMVYFGTGGGEARGIYKARFDPETGRLAEPELAAEVLRPGFLAFDPRQQFLYAACLLETEQGERIGGVRGFRVDRSNGTLEPINEQHSAGANPCHVAVDHEGRCLLVANYSGGNVAAFPLSEQGRIGPAASVRQHEGSGVHPQRQRAAHPHSVNVSPDNRFAFVADLGIDAVVVYRLNAAEAELQAHAAAKVAPGAGPRHFTFHPSGEFAFVINELDSTLGAFAYDAETGNLESLHAVSTLPPDFDEQNTTAEVLVHPNGRFVYASNRGHDTIAVFSWDQQRRLLGFVEHQPIRGRTPRNFGIDPTGRYLLAAGQNSDSVAVFRIDSSSGRLEFTGSEITVPVPICVKFLVLEKD